VADNITEGKVIDPDAIDKINKIVDTLNLPGGTVLKPGPKGRLLAQDAFTQAPIVKALNTLEKRIDEGKI
jgi:hypothetical protein